MSQEERSISFTDDPQENYCDITSDNWHHDPVLVVSFSAKGEYAVASDGTFSDPQIIGALAQLVETMLRHGDFDFSHLENTYEGPGE